MITPKASAIARVFECPELFSTMYQTLNMVTDLDNLSLVSHAFWEQVIQHRFKVITWKTYMKLRRSDARRVKLCRAVREIEASSEISITPSLVKRIKTKCPDIRKLYTRPSDESNDEVDVYFPGEGGCPAKWNHFITLDTFDSIGDLARCLGGGWREPQWKHWIIATSYTFVIDLDGLSKRLPEVLKWFKACRAQMGKINTMVFQDSSYSLADIQAMIAAFTGTDSDTAGSLAIKKVCATIGSATPEQTERFCKRVGWGLVTLDLDFATYNGTAMIDLPKFVQAVGTNCTRLESLSLYNVRLRTLSQNEIEALAKEHHLVTERVAVQEMVIVFLPHVTIDPSVQLSLARHLALLCDQNTRIDISHDCGCFVSYIGELVEFFARQPPKTKAWLCLADFHKLGIGRALDITYMTPLPDGSFPDLETRNALATVAEARRRAQQLAERHSRWSEDLAQDQARVAEHRPLFNTAAAHLRGLGVNVEALAGAALHDALKESDGASRIEELQAEVRVKEAEIERLQLENASLREQREGLLV